MQAIGITPRLVRRARPAVDRGPHVHRPETQDPDAASRCSTSDSRAGSGPATAPIDRRIGFRGGDDITWLRVVGVAPNVHYEEVGEDTDQSQLNLYVPYAMSGRARWRFW